MTCSRDVLLRLQPTRQVVVGSASKVCKLCKLTIVH